MNKIFLVGFFVLTSMLFFGNIFALDPDMQTVECFNAEEGSQMYIEKNCEEILASWKDVSEAWLAETSGGQSTTEFVVYGVVGLAVVLTIFYLYRKRKNNFETQG